MLRAVIRKHLKLFSDKYPATVSQVTSQLYVDDYPGGAHSLDEAKRTADEAIEIFADAKMHLRKWITNDRRLQAHLGGDQSSETVGVLAQAMAAKIPMKVLGIRWDTSIDAFFFDPSAIIEAGKQISQLTKRDVLRISSRIFDPIGLLAPTVLLL
jgi:hypothetical protein